MSGGRTLRRESDAMFNYDDTTAELGEMFARLYEPGLKDSRPVDLIMSEDNVSDDEPIIGPDAYEMHDDEDEFEDEVEDAMFIANAPDELAESTTLTSSGVVRPCICGWLFGKVVSNPWCEAIHH